MNKYDLAVGKLEMLGYYIVSNNDWCVLGKLNKPIKGRKDFILYDYEDGRIVDIGDSIIVVLLEHFIITSDRNDYTYRHRVLVRSDGKVKEVLSNIKKLEVINFSAPTRTKILICKNRANPNDFYVLNYEGKSVKVKITDGAKDIAWQKTYRITCTEDSTVIIDGTGFIVNNKQVYHLRHYPYVIDADLNIR